jgi:hypothetical protein
MRAPDMDPFRDTSHIESCCRTLTEASVDERDILLAHLVRLQMITEKIVRTFPRWRPQTDMRAPIAMVLRTFEAELAEFKASLPAALMQNGASLT